MCIIPLFAICAMCFLCRFCTNCAEIAQNAQEKLHKKTEKLHKNSTFWDLWFCGWIGDPRSTTVVMATIQLLSWQQYNCCHGNNTTVAI